MVELKILSIIEEQISVQFTGKVNVLSVYNRQFLGHLIFKDGDILQVSFQGQKGLKAFYQILIQEFSLIPYDYVVEPEVVDEKERQIHYPYSVLKNKLQDVLKLYKESLKLRPPEHVKILSEASFLDSEQAVSSEEFEVLLTLTEWTNPNDIYRHCSLLDHEITLALVSLRKKGALKIIAPQNNP
jgi:hypothetical protein